MRINKKKLLSYGIVLSMTAVSMLSTSPLASAAGNVKDEEFSFVSGVDSYPNYTRWREKKDTTMTYCYPRKYGGTYAKVSGCYYDKNKDQHLNVQNCSNGVFIPLNVQGLIVNYVREYGCNRARLYSYVNKGVATSGLWSPDSTENSSYTVFK